MKVLNYLRLMLAAFVLSISLSSLHALAQDSDKTTEKNELGNAFQEITWDDLMPPGWEPSYADEFDEFGGGYGGDHTLPAPKQEPAPVVAKLNNQKLRLPGYVIPVKFAENGVSEFLLVPYVGACIHVPPPPENQIVYVSLKEPTKKDQLWAPVWVNGTMTTQAHTTQYASTGYFMKDAVTEVYEFTGE